jgi:hypothetical protein
MHRQVIAAVLACAAATLFHHVHNAEFLAEYPNLPASLTRGGVYLAWLCATVAGAAGYLLLKRGWRRIGTGLLVAYGCYGLDGLVHYVLAPVFAHTPLMNLSIWLEAAAGTALLITLFRSLTPFLKKGS